MSENNIAMIKGVFVETENNIEPGQNIIDTKLIKCYSITCFGEKSSKYTSMKTAFAIYISAWSAFYSLNVHSSHILQIIFITLLFKFSYTCSAQPSSTIYIYIYMCVCVCVCVRLNWRH